MRRRWNKGASSATSRKIGHFAESEEKMEGPDAFTLARARQRARDWERIRKSGSDPREREKKEREGRDFAALAEDYMSRPDFKKQRQSKASERRIRHNLLNPDSNPWMLNAVFEIDDSDLASLIEEIKKRAPSTALHVRSDLKLIFRHGARAANRKRWGLRANPMADLSPKECDLEKNIRKFVLNDDEIVAFWRAAGKLGYPYGPGYQMLALTGQRKSDIFNASWGEIDLKARLFTIPEERFKSETIQMVPLSDACMDILSNLPGSPKGPFLFSTTGGVKPVNGFSRAKERLDALMLLELKKIAEACGNNPGQVVLRAFVNHDLRRVVRSRMSSLGVAPNVAELVIGHGKKGLERIYDQYEYLPEMRKAQQAWADALRELVRRTPGGDPSTHDAFRSHNA